MEYTIFESIMVFTSPSLYLIATRTNFCAICVIALHETVFCKDHRCAIILLTDSSTSYRVTHLIFQISSIVDSPPNKIIKGFTTPTTICTKVTPDKVINSTSTNATMSVPCPGLLAISIRSDKTNLWLQLSSYSNIKLLRSHHFLVVGIDILKVNCLVRIRTTSRNKVKYTTACTACKLKF